MSDQIARIESEAQAAIAGAGTTAELEEARIRYLGRKAELPNLLRGVAQLPPQERAATGKAANQARQALEQAIERKAAAARRRPSSTRVSSTTGSTSRCRPTRRRRSGACT